uniref:Putative mitochondrial inheritance and actin cytoskeleton organization protein n=1 Tax=Ixodes ricinus TaxID=34613 RepID=A0A0K8RKG3_IXORI
MFQYFKKFGISLVVLQTLRCSSTSCLLHSEQNLLISYLELFLCPHQRRISWHCLPTSELCSSICVWCS